MSNVVLVGSDVRAYTITPNGSDGFPGLGAAVNCLGVYKSIKVSLDLSRAKVKASSDLWVEKRLTDLDWSATLEHQVRSGGPLGLSMLMNVAFNVLVSFQEESGGNYWSLYGGIQRGEYSVVNEERMETLNIENIGRVGSGQSSIWYSSSPPSISQSMAYVNGGATAFQAYVG